MAEGLDFESELWNTCNKLRGSVDISQWKHVVLGLMFLKFISDGFEEKRKEISEKYSYEKDPVEKKAILESKDNYSFYLPEEARWSFIRSQVGQTNLPSIVDNAMTLIEDSNRRQLGGVMPKVYVRTRIPADTLGELVNTFTKINLGSAESKDKDVLGRVYEYFIKQFASRQTKKGGEFYTPQSIVQLLVEILEPYQGRIYDPACGSGGMFVQSVKFVKAHDGRKDDVAIYGQEVIDETLRICKMNLAIREVEGHLKLGDTLNNDEFSGMEFDYILANPPFNLRGWKRDKTDKNDRWKYGTVNSAKLDNVNANYYWIQHIVSHLKKDGMAGFVLANGSLSAGGQEGEIRKKLIEDDLVDCVIALPPQLFYTVQIPACLWFLNKSKNGKNRNRKGETLFIDAREIITRINRTQVEFSEEQLNNIAETVRKYRGEIKGYEDVKGYCKIAKIEDIKKQNYVLTPGRYVGIKPEEQVSKQDFDKQMKELTTKISKQFEKSKKLEQEIKKNLGGLGFKI